MSDEPRNNDGTVRTRTQLARDVYEAANEAAMQVYKAVIREEFPPGTKVQWLLRIGKPKMTGVVHEVNTWAWSDKVRVTARTGTTYDVRAWELDRVPDGVKTAAPTLGNGGNFTRGPTHAKPPAPAAPPPIAGVTGADHEPKRGQPPMVAKDTPK